MMIRYLLILFPILGMSGQIEMAHVTQKPLGHIVHTNAQITQLSDQKQEIVSRLSGHVEAYYVKAGEAVKTGDKMVLIESIALSKLSADFLAFMQQIRPAQAQVNTTRKLYKKGLSSKNELNAHLLSLETLRSQKNALASQLKTLGVDAAELTKATDKFTLYAHADGVVGKILVSLHANVDAQTPLMTLVNQSGYYATAFLSVDDAMQVNKETKGWVKIAGKSYPCHFVQLLPHIDEETQRAKVRFSIENSPTNLLLGAFTQMEIALTPSKEVLMVKKSALTLFKGEWVVFVEAHHEEHEEHKEESHEKDEHEGHDHTKHEAENHEEEKEDSHDGHDGHEEEEEAEEAPYEARVVDIIAYSGDDVAVKGLELGEEYVSEGVYFVKSLLLKSSLGGHGH